VLEALLFFLCLQEPLSPPPLDPQQPLPRWLTPLHGTVSVKFKNRWTGNQSDADLLQYLSLTCGDPARDAVTAAASARFSEDLDGERDASGFYAFDSIDDTYHHGSTGRLYTAYLDLHRALPGMSVRAGRQVLDELPEAVPMDGALVRQTLLERLSLGAFGGVPVNLFESSTDGDAMFGGWLEARPWDRGWVRVEYLHLDDENVFGAFDDDLVGVVLEQGEGPCLLTGRHTLLEGESRESVVRMTGGFAEAGLILDAQASYLHERQQALSYPIDPYSVFLFELEPYLQGSLRASKAFGAAFSLDLSYTRRELAKDEDEGAYNHEFSRLTIAPRTSGWPLRSLSLALSGDLWNSSRDEFWTAGGDLAWQASPRLSLGAGTAYALYTIDAFTGEERERVRSVSVSLRWKWLTGSIFDARFSIEEGAEDRFRALEVGIRHAF
jgi:hypothetical protein